MEKESSGRVRMREEEELKWLKCCYCFCKV
jgi:hypothetical protein